MEEAQKPQESTYKKKNFLQKNAIIIGIVAFLIVAIGGGAFAFVSSRAASNADEEEMVDTTVVETLDPETLGLSITAKPDKKAVKFTIEKAADIKTVEYQLTYEADSTAQEKAEGGDDRVQRGITGEAAISGGKASYESEWLDLGSCSRNVCKYDKGVESVDLTLKIIKKNGKTYESVLNHPLN
jgi:hypothetical protein